jgi:hypothetical protein
MAYQTVQEYIQAREAYCYDSPNCNFSIEQTGYLKNTGNFTGIFARNVPSHCSKGINLRRFEAICQEIFRDCSDSIHKNIFSIKHEDNLKNISSAIVYWKMSSQGGRSSLKVSNMLDKWNGNNAKKLIIAFRDQKMEDFCIGGVLIPTATAFIRFLYPNYFGIMDSRVLKNHTQPNNITTLSVRAANGYPNNTKANINKYYLEYIPFLRKEADWLNSQNATFQDTDALGNFFTLSFRACDVEMALFQK